jgi:hypothetical protein
VSLIQRVKNILFAPISTWQQIEAEEATTAGGYIAAVAAVPALVAFLQLGINAPGSGGLLGFKLPALGSWVAVLPVYLAALASVGALALLVDALAHASKVDRNPLNALKLVTYSMTASLLGSVSQLLPMSWLLSVLASGYSLYLFYLGVPILMKCSPEAAKSYTAYVGIGAVVIMLLLGAISKAVMPDVATNRTPPATPAPAKSSLDMSQLPGTSIVVSNTNPELALKPMQEAVKRLEAQHATIKPEDESRWIGDAVLALTATGQAAMTFSADQLKPFVPEALLGTRRNTLGVEKMAISSAKLEVSVARGQYIIDASKMQIEIIDMGLNRLALASWAIQEPALAKEKWTQRVFKNADRVTREREHLDKSQSEIHMLLPNGVIVQASGNLPLEQLKSGLMGLDVQALGQLRR